MLKVQINDYIQLGGKISSTAIVFQIMDDAPEGDADKKLTQDERNGLRADLTEVIALCKTLELPVSVNLLTQRMNDLPQTGREYDVLMDALKSELEGKLFLFVPSGRSKYYQWHGILSAEAKTSFPSAHTELMEAGNCVATGAYTACVFHCMRALEHGLRALAKNVRKKFDVQNWQNIIEQIESAISHHGKTLRKGLAKSKKLQFLSAAAKEFTYFKDGWRNHVSHNRASYNEEEALVILNHVRSFMTHLASKLKE
jgi:hypothetical protein